MKFLALFVAGLVTGAGLSWLYFRGALKTYQNYIRDRIDKVLEQARHDERVAGPASPEASPRTNPGPHPSVP